MITYEIALPRIAPERFEDLCKVHMPRTIHDKNEFDETVRVMDWIAIQAHNTDMEDYAATLADLVTTYEVANDLRVKPKLSGLELLKEIVSRSGVTQVKLASILGVEQGTVSKIMTGDRSITIEHAKRIAKHFKVKAAALLHV
jgi:antitoxin component HigA of HigAB toxin-antitoxin module